MKINLVPVVVAIGAVTAGPALASGDISGRVGLTAGTFEYNDQQTCDPAVCFFFDDAGNPVQSTGFTYDDTTYGLIGGLRANVEWFFVDYGLEYSAYASAEEDLGEELYRTDNLLSAGVYLDRWTVFGGYRHALFGDGFMSEEGGNTEEGPFLGGAVSFQPGRKIALGLSLAYNWIDLSFEGESVEGLDVAGLSAKFQMNVLDTPHSVYLRFQRFEGDYDEPGFQYEYDESYLNLGYQATFDFVTW